MSSEHSFLTSSLAGQDTGHANGIACFASVLADACRCHGTRERRGAAGSVRSHARDTKVLRPDEGKRTGSVAASGNIHRRRGGRVRQNDSSLYFRRNIPSMCHLALQLMPVGIAFRFIRYQPAAHSSARSEYTVGLDNPVARASAAFDSPSAAIARVGGGGGGDRTHEPQSLGRVGRDHPRSLAELKRLTLTTRRKRILSTPHITVRTCLGLRRQASSTRTRLLWTDTPRSLGGNLNGSEKLTVSRTHLDDTDRPRFATRTALGRCDLAQLADCGLRHGWAATYAPWQLTVPLSGGGAP